MELYSDGSIWNADAGEMSMSVEDGKAEIILIESGEETKVELQGDVEGNALVLKAVTEDEAGTMFFSLDNMKFNLLDDGKLCLIAEDDAEESDDGEEADDSETGEVDFSVKTYAGRKLVYWEIENWMTEICVRIVRKNYHHGLRSGGTVQ